MTTQNHPKGISVIVCCYNSVPRLTPTLTHLFAQVTQSLDWEIIVVDNNSSDETAAFAQSLGALHNTKQIPLIIVKEPTPGLSAARKKGTNTAKYDLLLFVDDDNHLDENYLQTVNVLMRKDESVAILGAYGEPVFDEGFTPPQWFPSQASCYALGAQSSKSYDDTLIHAYGAGFTVRRSAWEHLKAAGFESQLSDRKGASLVSGGDTEWCMALRLAGYKIAYDERLRFKHYMPAGRINWTYLQKLYRGFGKAKVVTDAYTFVMNNDYNPNDRYRLPYWLDRLIHLRKAHKQYGRERNFSEKYPQEGNAEYLLWLGQKGEIEEIWHMKSKVHRLYTTLLTLKKNLKQQ